MEKIKIGFVGAGWMGKELMKRFLDRDDVEIAALHQTSAERAGEVLSELGLSKDLFTSDYASIIGNPGIDAVCIASPNSLHGQQAIAALRARKHVFCEKPCATTFAEFIEQIELDRANPGLVTFVDYIMAFDSMEGHLRQMVADGHFGEITQVQVNYRHPVNITGNKSWKLRQSIMGDALGMGIIHSLFAMVNMMESQSRPVGVFATSQDAKVRDFEAATTWNVLVRFGNGATGLCFGNIDVSNGYDAYHNVSGSAGGFVFDSQQERTHKIRYWSDQVASGKWIFPLDRRRCRDDEVEELVWPDDTTTPDSGNVVEHQTGACVGHFLDCIQTEKQSFLSFANSSHIAELGWAAQISAATGREVGLPLDLDEAGEFFSA